MGIPAEKQDQETRGRLPVNDPRQCTCEVRHVALRHLLYAGESDAELELAERVTHIKTKYWIGEEEQSDLYQAAKLIIKLLDAKRLLAEPSFQIPCATAPAQESVG